MTTLYSAAAHDVALPQTLNTAAFEGACALLTAPSAYHVAKVEDGRCVTPSGPVDLSTVYEARLFTPTAEVRWVGSGAAVFLTEDENAAPPLFTWPLPDVSAVTTFDRTYLVWGSVATAANGWISLRSSRTADLTLPMAQAPGADRVVLTAKEYVVADPEHGNAYVAEERLTGFKPYVMKGAE
ncbi:CRISPR-associated protein, TIGR03984 family [Sinosporangium album]|uniref:CRISPR-associated protein, TIGR03984 family n=1 Tax=Sinosporangium album TaxID=504805 RepID=A0A1G7VR84_9ACTN|nr:CRISPR-associated protein Csx19 [Sinosporangium album]SDG62332.1 CRISPR-associated protein, TIGR03984 family [Sinosporangium album]